MVNWTVPKYNFMKHTIVLDDRQFTGCIPLSKREAKIKNQAGFFVFDKFTLQVNLGYESWWRLNQPFKHTFSHHVSGKRSTMRPFFLSYRPRT